MLEIQDIDLDKIKFSKEKLHSKQNIAYKRFILYDDDDNNNNNNNNNSNNNNNKKNNNNNENNNNNMCCEITAFLQHV